MVNPRCYLDISLGGELEGRMVIELYKDIVPKTAENFRALCTGEKGIGPHTAVPLHFKGSCFHHVIRGFMLQGGDISAGNGSGGESIYGLTFEDENFKLKHERKGMLSMANSGPNTNGSQFFITASQAHILDGKNVVFGRVIRGLGMIRAIEHVKTSEDGFPDLPVIIEDCGEIPEGADDGTVNFFKDGDTYPDWPIDLDVKPDEFAWWINAVDSIKGFGNEHYKKEDYKMAIRKYRKAVRYTDLCWDKEDIDEGELSKSEYLRKTKSQILANSSTIHVHTLAQACKLKFGDLTGALLDADAAIYDGEDNVKAFTAKARYLCGWEVAGLLIHFYLNVFYFTVRGIIHIQNFESSFALFQAYMAMNATDAAAESFKKALQLEPNNGGIKKELAAAMKKITCKLDQEKKGYAKMFQ
ncbi:hypothetical protein RND71_032855 [Anisodus tanguticus]|uniref:peptidylprolyl isomerase n=1 Tax=Anisodus tanguticus TaxID=243964 RepID=A0AAE1R782_9SOLA|nr:hypothetical protein RND71_032855 [Anisodus tanguticus]